MVCTRSNRGACAAFNRGLTANTGYIPEGAQFLQDTFPLKVLKTQNTIAEGFDGRETPAMRVTGLFQLGDMLNANGRVYQTPILQEAVQLIQEDVTRRAVMGEFDHPPDAKIHLDRVSHLLTKVWMEGNKVYGEAEVLSNQPHGAMLKGLFESKVQVGISSRGIGDMEVKEENGQEVYYVTPGYAFVTWDAVAEPSVSGAVLQLMEGKLKPIKKALNEQVEKRIISSETAEKLLVEQIQKFFS